MKGFTTMSPDKLVSLLNYYRERNEPVNHDCPNRFYAMIIARNKTETAFVYGKVFRFHDGRDKNLPREKRYSKRIARFMDWLEKNNIPFAVSCHQSTSSPLASLIFEGKVSNV
jgi:hypothetical protein